LTLNVSTITTGCFQMTKVLSVNDRAKVWEIKKLLRDLPFHINTKK
jgi:hypothetical protein